MKTTAHSHPTNLSQPPKLAPGDNIVVIGLGGYGTDVLTRTNGLGARSSDAPFSNALIVDSEVGFLERSEGRKFLAGGGTVIRLSHADVRQHAEAAMEERSTAPYAREIKAVWGDASLGMLSDSLKAVENGRGGCGVRTVTALGCYSAASEILGKIVTKIHEARKSNVDPRAVTKVIIIGSIDGSVGSGASTTISYLLLRKVHNIEISIHAARHNPNEIAGYAGNESQVNLLRANSAQWLAEMEGLSEAASSMSKTSSIRVIELLDGETVPVTTGELVAAHARALEIAYNLGADSFHERRRVNETFLGRSGAFRIISGGVAYEIPQELKQFGQTNTEIGFIDTLAKEGTSFACIDGALSHISGIKLPADRTESVLAATSVAGAMALFGKANEDLNGLDAEMAEQVAMSADQEKQRVLRDVGTLLAQSLPLQGVHGAESALKAAICDNEKTLKGLNEQGKKLRSMANLVEEGIEVIENQGNTLQRLKALPRLHQAGVGITLLISLALLSIGDLASSALGGLLLTAAVAATFFFLKVRTPQINKVIESLVRKLRARRDLISLNFELTLHSARNEALSALSAKVASLQQRLNDRREKLQHDLNELELKEDATRYSVLSRRQFDEVIKGWGTAAVGNFDTIEAESVLEILSRRASNFANEQFAQLNFGKLDSQSLESLDRIASTLSAAAKAPNSHQADPGRVPRPELWVTTSTHEVYEGEASIRKVLQSARSAQGIYFLGWQRGLKAADLLLAEELKDAAAGMNDIPTRTLPSQLQKKHAKSVKPLAGTVHRQSTVNGYTISDFAA